MKPGFRSLFLFVFILLQPTLHAYSSAITQEPPRSVFFLKASEVCRLTGIKMTFKQKIAWGILRKQTRKNFPSHPVTRDRAKTALILGIIGMAICWVPVLNIAAIPLAILAVTIGSKAKRDDPGDRRARSAVTIGIITLCILFVYGLLAAYLLSTPKYF